MSRETRIRVPLAPAKAAAPYGPEGDGRAYEDFAQMTLRQVADGLGIDVDTLAREPYDLDLEAIEIAPTQPALPKPEDAP